MTRTYQLYKFLYDSIMLCMNTFMFTIEDVIEVGRKAFDTKRTVPDTNEGVSGTVFSVADKEKYIIVRGKKMYFDYTLQEIDEIDQYNKDLVYRKVSKKNEWFWLDINASFIEPVRDRLLLLERLRKNPTKKKDLNIEKAKQFPISSLIDFRYRKAKCIFHEDHSPSLYYYPNTNTVYCFACNTFADSIKVYQTIHQCTFRKAVLALQ